MTDSVWVWLKEKWKVVTGALLVVAGIFSIVLRNRNSKAVFKNAKESHEKETKINAEAERETTEGLKRIQEESNDRVADAIDVHKKKREEIKKEKSEFIKDSIASETLAEDIAKHIGAEFVKDDE